MFGPISLLASELSAGRTTSRKLVETALARIADPKLEGSRAFMKVYSDAALAEADASDRLRALGVVRSPATEPTAERLLYLQTELDTWLDRASRKIPLSLLRDLGTLYLLLLLKNRLFL